VRLWRARLGEDGGLTEVVEAEAPPRYAFLGARSCELHAMWILERVLGSGARAADAFVVAVQCGQAGGTCCCASMQTGPTAESGFDPALTEVLEGGRHYFVVDVGSERGAEVLGELPHAEAHPREQGAAEAAHARAVAQMGREIDVSDIRGRGHSVRDGRRTLA
jgi:sulfhydrogenase subunit beta (sulfur reductase)